MLLGTRQLSNALEDALHFADGPGASREGLGVSVGEELVDANVKGLRHEGQEVGARGLRAPLPEGDIALRDAEKVRELGLRKAGFLPQREQKSALLGSRAFR